MLACAAPAGCRGIVALLLAVVPVLPAQAAAPASGAAGGRAVGVVGQEQPGRCSEAGTVVCLGASSFDWTDVDDQDRAHFRWTAEVLNDGARAFRVRVTVELLDADDGVVTSDSATASVEAGGQVAVEHTGVLAYDRAADVVSFRFRVEPLPRSGL